jgi:hypothetical protein
MKKHFLPTMFFALFLAGCMPKEGVFDHIDFSGPCQEPVTKVNIKTADAYSKAPVPKQQFRLKLREIFSVEKVLKEVVTSDSGKVGFAFEHDSENYFNAYWVEQATDSSAYIAVSIPALSVGCSNDLDISMKKAGTLALSLKNKSAIAHGKCRLTVHTGVATREVLIDTLPIGFARTYGFIKLPEERLWITLYALKTVFKQQDTLYSNAAAMEAYTMTLR